MLIAAASSGVAEEVVLGGVPNYRWYEGCSPTSGMMLLGYWDSLGYPDLIPGTSHRGSDDSAIGDSIASVGNITDYAQYNGIQDSEGNIYRDRSEINPDGAHPDDSLADFMRTSRSAYGLWHGATSADRIGGGMEAYASWRGYSVDAGGSWSSTPSWDDFVHEINMGRPVLFDVDTSSDGTVNHTVTTTAWRTSNGFPEYYCHDTWGRDSWHQFRTTSTSYRWGIGGMHTLRPASVSRDTLCSGASGVWQTVPWSNGLPNSSSYAGIGQGASVTVAGDASARYVMNLGDVVVQSGTLTTGTLAVAGTMSQSGGTVSAAEIVAVGREGHYMLSDGQLTAGTAIAIDREGRLEWAGGDVHTPLLVVELNSEFSSHVNFSIGSSGNIGRVEGYAFSIDNGISVEHADHDVDVPTVFVKSGEYLLSGTGRIMADHWVYVGYDSTARLAQSDQTTVATRNLALGSEEGSSGTYELSGGSLSAENEIIGRRGHGVFIQTGGLNSLSAKLTVGERNALSASYRLDDGRLTTRETVVADGHEDYGATAEFEQSGGTHTVADTLFVGNPLGTTGTYRLGGGNLLAGQERIGEVGTGRFFQSGGLNRTGYLIAGVNSRYELSGGTLFLEEGMTLLGELDCTDSEAMVLVMGGIANWGQGTLLGTGQTSVLGGDNSLIVLPAGFDPETDFKSFVTAGLTHISGATLTIPAGRTIVGRGRIDDHVDCRGTLQASAGDAVNLYGGIRLSPGARADLGMGELVAHNDMSRVTGGELLAGTMYLAKDSGTTAALLQDAGAVTIEEDLYVGYGNETRALYELGGSGQLRCSSLHIRRAFDGSPSSFSHTSGAVTAENSVTVDGLYTLSGDAQLSTGGILLDAVGARFVQIDGTNRTGSLALAYSQGSGLVNGTYELHDGILEAGSTEVGRRGVAEFIQNGGTHTITDGRLRLAHLGTGRYYLNGGQLLAPDEEIGKWGYFYQSGGTNTVAGRLTIEGSNVSLYSISGGRLSVGQLLVGASSWGTLNISSSEATVTIAERLLLGWQSAVTAVPGSTIHMRGAALDISSQQPEHLEGLRNLTRIFHTK